MSRPLVKKVSRQEIESMADMIAKNARLDRPLPPDTDFTNEEMKEIQTQLNTLATLPADALESVYLAFSAKHLPALATALRALSLASQRKTVSTLIQILSLLPNPLKNHYFRKFLQTSQVQGLPTLIANNVVKGVDWLPPSGPGYVFELVSNTLACCDAGMGDDKKAPIDKEVRIALAVELREFISSPDFSRLDDRQQTLLHYTTGILHVMNNYEGPAELHLIRDQALQMYVKNQKECDVCKREENLLACSRCKTVKYCSAECQNEAWKKGHEQRCFTTDY